MTGHLVKRSGKKNAWSIVLELPRGADGKRKQKWITFHGPKKAAEAEMARLVHELATGIFVIPTRLTVAEHLEHWLATVVQPKRSLNTYRIYSSIVRKHFIPAFGHLLLQRLSTQAIEQYYAAKLGEGLSAATVSVHHAVLRAALRKAVVWQLLHRNPALIEDPPRSTSAERQPYSGAELGRLLAAAEESTVYGPILLAAALGLCIGEVCGLQWGDVDLQAGTLDVRRNLGAQADYQLGFAPLKTKYRRRSLPLPPIAWEFLRGYRALQEPLALPPGARWYGVDALWRDANGCPLSPDLLRSKYYEVIERAGLRKLRFHDLRHCHATLMLREKVPLHVISRRLGHANTTITGGVYAHVMPGMQEEASATADALLRRVIPPEVR